MASLGKSIDLYLMDDGGRQMAGHTLELELQFI